VTRFCADCTDDACPRHQAIALDRDSDDNRCFFEDDKGRCPSPMRAHNSLGCYRHPDMPFVRERDDDLVCIGGGCCYLCEGVPKAPDPAPVAGTAMSLFA
jgi:hypothetical protein